MQTDTQLQVAHATLQDMEERIHRKRQEFLAHGVVGDSLDHDLEAMMAQHSRIRDALYDAHAPARQTLEAEMAVLRSMFERWVASNERRFATG